MIYLLCIIIALWGVFRGIDEGIDMNKPSNREHRWYKHYHWFPNIRDILGICIGGCAVYIGRDLLQWSSVALLFGSIVLMWECFELAYSYTRYQSFIPASEHIMGAGIYVYGKAVKIVHAVRLALAVAFVSFVFWRKRNGRRGDR